MRIGIVSGLGQQADAIFQGQGTVERRGLLALRDAGPALVASVGLGKVYAAMAASALVAEGCTTIVMAGVAGRIAPVDGDCFWIAGAVEHDYGALRDDRLEAFTPGLLPIGAAKLEPFAAIADPGLGLPAVCIASGDQFVTDPEEADRIAALADAQLIDMETAAVAQVASAYGLGWAGIAAVTDDADEDGASDFAANLNAAIARAAAATERLVALLPEAITF